MGQGALLALWPRCQKILSLLSSPYGYPDRDYHRWSLQVDLAVATWVTRKSLIASVGLDPINMNWSSMNSHGALDETILAQSTF